MLGLSAVSTLSEAAALPLPPGVPARRVLGATRRQALVVTVLCYVGTSVWGWAGYVEELRIGHVYLAPALAIAVLSQLWPVDRPWRHGDSRRIGAAAALLAIANVLAGVPLGAPLGAAAAKSVVFVGLAVAFLAAYRRGVAAAEWFPTQGSRVRALVGLCGLHSAAMVLLGGVPPAGIGGTGDHILDMSWLAICYVDTLYALMFFFALAHPLRQFARVQHAATVPFGAVIGMTCLTLPGVYPDFPLDWMTFIPAIWIGLTLPPRLAVVASMSLPALSYDLGRYNAPAAFTVIDTALQILLLVMCAWIVTSISAHREQLDRLLAGVDEVATTEANQGALLDAVLTALDDGVLVATPDRRVLLSNPAARSMLGLAAHGQLERDWLHEYDVRHQDGSPLTRTDVNAMLQPGLGSDVHLTVRGTEPDGGERFYTVTARRIANGDAPVALILIADSTAEHARQAELEAFAGDVAHDLKGPLTAVAIWMDTAEAEAEDDIDAGRQALRRACQASQRMRDTIDECLAYTTTRSGLLHPRDVDLQAVVREVASVYEAAGTTVEVAVNATVRADPTLVRRLIGNLIGNSVKYARPGEPARVRVSTVPGVAPGWTRVRVEDRGIGLGDADAETIFRKYSRTARGSATGEGTGLGLALCRSIVERHRGRITAAGNEWGGATIEFTLPEGGTLVR